MVKFNLLGIQITGNCDILFPFSFPQVTAGWKRVHVTPGRKAEGTLTGDVVVSYRSFLIGRVVKRNLFRLVVYSPVGPPSSQSELFDWGRAC